MNCVTDANIHPLLGKAGREFRVAVLARATEIEHVHPGLALIAAIIKF